MVSMLILNSVLYLIAFTLVFWGLRLFKVFIILIGLSAGLFFGSIFGEVIARSSQGFIIGALVLGAIGALIAWPLQKMFIFLVAGFFTAAFGVIILLSVGATNNILAISWFLLFLIGGVLAMSLYEYFIIIIFAYSGAQINFISNDPIYHITKIENAINGTLTLLVSDLPDNGLGVFNGIAHVWREFLHIYSPYIVKYVFVIILYICFAVFFQKFNARVEADEKQIMDRKNLFRRTSYLFVAIAFFGGYFSYFFNYNFRAIFPSVFLVGFDLISLPIIVYITFLFTHRLNKKRSKGSSILNSTGGNVVSIIIFSAAVIPFVHWSIVSLVYLDTGLLTYKLPMHFQSFAGKTTISSIKWIFSIIAFPLLIYILLVKPGAGEKTQSAGITQ